MNRDAGVEDAIRAAGGIGARERGLASEQPIPDRDQDDDIRRARAAEYALLASLLLRAPDAAVLARLARLQGDATPLGLAHIALAEAAGETSAADVQREFFELFIGVGRGELLPYASYYLTGFLNDRPLAALRADMAGLGLERAAGQCEPEDHLGMICEIMSGLAVGAFAAEASEERRFFARHVVPWARRCFVDLETAKTARFYRAVGAVGRLMIEIEAEAFAMDA